MLFDATFQQGLEGIVSKRLSSRYDLRPAQPALAEVPAPAPQVLRRRRLAAGGGHVGPAGRGAGRRADAGRAALPRPGRQRHRRQGRAPCCTRLLAPLARGDSPFDDEVPRSTPPARTGSSRSWSSTSSRSDSRAPAAPAAVVPGRPRRPDPGGPLMSARCSRRCRCVAPLPALARLGAAAAARRARPSHVDPRRGAGRPAPRARQVVTVNHTRGYHARLTLLAADRRGVGAPGSARHDGRIGYGGLVRRQAGGQGTGTTPLGTYRLLSAFGTHARARPWDLAHRRIRRGRLLGAGQRARATTTATATARQGGFRWWLPASDANASERLTDYPRQYEYAIVTSLQPGAGPAPRLRDLPARQRSRGHRRLCQRPARVPPAAVEAARPRARPVIAIGR